MANTIQRYKEITVKDKTYKLQFTIKAIILCEPNLTAKSILKTLSDTPFSYADTFAFAKWALFGGGNPMKDEEVEALLMDYFEENNLGDLQALLIEALVNSGVIGKIDAGKN